METSMYEDVSLLEDVRKPVMDSNGIYWFGRSSSVFKEICFGHPRIGDHIGMAWGDFTPLYVETCRNLAWAYWIYRFILESNIGGSWIYSPDWIQWFFHILPMSDRQRVPYVLIFCFSSHCSEQIYNSSKLTKNEKKHPPCIDPGPFGTMGFPLVFHIIWLCFVNVRTQAVKFQCLQVSSLDCPLTPNKDRQVKSYKNTLDSSLGTLW